MNKAVVLCGAQEVWQESEGNSHRRWHHKWGQVLRKSNGEGEIRTPVTLAGQPVFETGAFNRSATSPKTAKKGADLAAGEL